MNNKSLNLLIDNKEFLNEKINSYLKKNILTKTNSEYEIKGHLEKARHNLLFLSEIKPHFSDWSLVVCYYTVYHSALALILTKNFSSKNHDATICVILKEFYNKELTIDEINLLNMFDIQDILFYAEAKNKREDANYSTKTKYDKKEVEKIKLKTKLFVNKTEKIIKN